MQPVHRWIVGCVGQKPAVAFLEQFERFERGIPQLMDELASPQLPDYLDDMLRQTARTSQRPAWASFS